RRLFRAAFGRSQANWESFFYYVPVGDRGHVRREACAILAIHGSLLAAAVLWAPSLLGIFAAQIGGHALISWVTAGDHNGLESTGGHRDTRTIMASALTNFIFWNMPYHAEHHAYPGIPFYHLPRAHRDGLLSAPHVAASYPSFHADVVEHIKGGAPYAQSS
ncbi:MAG: fatty acid desaturase, partial [Pseudomonadota bacterium]